MQPDGHVEVLGRCPDGIKVRMAKTFTMNREGANKDTMHSGFGQSLDLLNRRSRVTQRNMAQWIEDDPDAPWTRFDRPTVIRPTMGGGEFRIFNQVFPEQSKGGIDKLAFYPFDIKEVNALIHILKRMAKRVSRIKGFEPLA